MAHKEYNMKLFGNKKDKMSTKEQGVEQEEKDKKDNTQEEGQSEAAEATAQGTSEETSEDLSDLEKKEIEYKELHEKFLRLYSEFDNFRKRTAKEKIDITKTASENVLKDLLPVLDDFERAITNNEKVDDIEAVEKQCKDVAQ